MGGCCNAAGERGKPQENVKVKKPKKTEIGNQEVEDPEIKLYWIRASQPSRALYTFLETARIEFEDCELQFGESRKPEYLAINPKGQVPFMTVDGVCYNESCSMLRYLAQRIPRL